MRPVSLKLKIQLSAAGLCLFLAGSALVAVQFGAERAARYRIEAELARAPDLVRALLRAKLESMRGEIEIALADPAFRSQISSSQVDPGHPLLSRFPLLAIVSNDGKRIYSKSDRAFEGKQPLDAPLARQALSEGQAAMILDGDLLALGIAVRGADGPVGAVIAGEPATSNLLPEMREALRADVDLGATNAQPESPGTLTLSVPLEGFSPADSLGVARVSRSLNDEVAPFRKQIRLAILVVFLGLAALIVPMAAFLSRGITGPIDELSKRVRRVRSGDLTGALDVRSNDELGQLAHAFNEMTEGLRERDALKELNEAKSRFFANVNHELRTPLTLILGPLDSILKSNETPSRHFLESLAANARRLLRQVNLLLDFSKLDAKRMELHLSNCNLGQLLDDLVRTVYPHASRKGVKVRAGGLASIPTSRFDRDKIETVAANLLSNALKYTPSGGTVTVRAKCADDRISFEVEDTGPGIPESRLGRIFERFYRYNEDSQRGGTPGTGLGLAMARELTELHDGKIRVESQVGRGTSFQVEIPFIAPLSVEGADLAATQSPATLGARSLLLSELVSSSEGQETPTEEESTAAVNRAARESFDRAKPTVLYVDDNPGLRSYVRNLLSSRYNVFLGADGQEGLDLARLHNPDLILSDVMMPEMDGTEFCRRVRQDVDLKALPFVMLTAKASLESRIEGLDEGADDYLMKPFSDAELHARVRNLITLRAAQVRLKRELQAAREIQLSLLPPAEQEFSGARLEMLYHPCEELSGDFFDSIHRGDWLYFYLADVTNHGTASAQVTYLVRNIFRNALGIADAPTIPQLLATVARKYADHGLKYDVGIQVGRLSLPSRTLEFWRGNAPAPLRLPGTSGGWTVLESSAGPGEGLSALRPEAQAATHIDVTTVSLEPGDRLFFFTDGAFQFGPRDKRFNRKGLLNLLKAGPVEDWRKNAFEGLVAANQGSTSFEDDLTIVRLSIPNS